MAVSAQEPKFSAPAAKPGLFFREPWRQPAALDASTDWDAAFPVTPAAVTNPDLELKVYDPNAGRIAEYAKKPPQGSLPRDWIGTSCVILSGYNQGPAPAKVVHGDPPIRRTSGPASAVRLPSPSDIAPATWTSAALPGCDGSRACQGSTWCGRR